MRAYQKRVIFLKNTGTDSFESAYFVISDKCAEKKDSEDMVSEAKRIIKESFGKGTRFPRIFRASFVFPFVLGVGVAVAVFFLLHLVVF